MGLFSKDTSDWLDGSASVLAEHDDRLDLQVTVPNRPTYTLAGAKQDIPPTLRGTLQGRTLPVKVHPEKDDRIRVDWTAVATAPAPGRTTTKTTFTMPVQVSRETKVIDASSIPGLGEEILGALAQHGIQVGAPGGATVVPAAGEDPLDRLKKLGDLHTAGVLTDAEFEAEKKKILGEA